MIAEQLQAARAAHWRQNQSPLLTLDDAQNWCRQHPLCLFLPRPAQLPAPAPSFVEACMGSRHSTPSADAIAQAQSLLTRLIASGNVVALNLFGSVSEQPDFLAHSEALPFVLSLRADADWKHAPQKSSGHKVSPLVLELWKALDKDGVLTAAQARESLGRELTEAAVLRGLCELWQALRISPAYAEESGQPARWEMLRLRHRAALATATATSQVTALSLLVSMYLQSVYAATSEEIEIFLSPVASRSRVREAVRGLSATRQIHALSMDAQTYHFLENGLPEFAELPAAEGKAEPMNATLGTTERRPAAKPTPRRMQAIRPPDQTAGQAPPAASAPIYRRPKPETLPQPAAARSARPASRPPARPGAPGRAPWQPAARPGSKPASRPAFRTSGPPARGGRPAGREGDARSSSLPHPGAGSRPSFSPRRPFPPPGGSRPDSGAPGAGARPDSRPTGTRPDTRAPRTGAQRSAQRPYARPGGARPDTRGGARPPARPGAWAGADKRDQPKPWALPGRKPASGPRPPRAGARGDAPFRPRPAAGRASGGRPSAGRPADGAPPFRPRTPRPDQSPGQRPDQRRDRGPDRARSSRPAGRPSASYGANRPSAPGVGRSSGRPPASFRARPRPGGTGRPSAPPGGAARYDRPARGGSAKPFPRPSTTSRPSPGGADKGRGGKEGRPFVPRPDAGRPPRSGPPKSGPPKFNPRGGPSSGKPGRPPARFSGRKPDRKKPGA